VRLSAVGDVIHAMPLANALRERFPKAFLTWVAANPAATLLQGHEALDELIVLPRRWMKSPGSILDLRRRLRALKFDVAIDAQGLAKSAIAAWLSGAPRRIGYGDQWGRELSRWLHTDLVYTKTKHTVDRTLELIEPLGIVRPTVRFRVPISDAEREAAETVLREAGIEGRFAIINSGAGWPSKLWPPERFAAVARHLGRQWSLPVIVVWAGEEERTLAETIVPGSEACARLAPPTTLRELAALSQRAAIFVSSDTGPIHLAVAVGTPCVGLYGPWPAEGHGPYGPGHVVLQKMTIYGTTSQRRRASRELMEAIDVPSVCAACDEILGGREWGSGGVEEKGRGEKEDAETRRRGDAEKGRGGEGERRREGET
jgi:lipopolysaccharide heptosyltransferase I